MTDSSEQQVVHGEPPVSEPAREASVSSVSVFFPCYDDAATIGGLVERAAQTIDALGIEGDIVVVNDGSRDDSAEVLTATAAREPRLRIVTHERNGGYGAALQSGFAAADREWVFYTDGDGQYDPSELANLVAAAGDDVDVVQGYKLERGDNLARRIIGRVYHHFVSLLFGLRIRDTDCDFRLIRRRVLEHLELDETSGVICVELVRKLQDAGARVVEVGVHHYPRVSGTSTFFKPRNVVRTLRDLVLLWLALVVRGRTTTVEPPPSRRIEWGEILAPFFVSRAISDALLIALGMLRTPTDIFSGFSTWDGHWYRAIALHGYVVPPHAVHHQTPWPFFPLLPEVLRAFASVGIPVTAAGVLVNHVAFLVALIGVHRLASRHGSPSTTRLAVWLAALGPMSFVFSMLYPSAIFLAASVWAFVLVEEHRDLAAGLAAAIAALSRPNGIIVVLALLVAVGFAIRRVVVLAVPVVVALAGWMWFNALRTGDPLRFFDAKRAWHEVTVFNITTQLTPDAALHLAVAALAMALVVLVRRRIPSSWLWYTILGLVPSLVFGVVGLARYATDSFPPTIAAAMLLDRGAAAMRRNLLLGLVALQAAFAFWFVGLPRLI